MHTKGKLVIRNNYATGVEPKDYLQWIDADTEDGGQSICDICGIDAEANENAKRIVLCWNSHDKLLEALKDIAENSSCIMACAVARGAIEEAEEH
jgi:hypothetical protein